MHVIQTELVVPFIDATKHTFELMLNKQVKQKEVYVKKSHVMFGDISGCIDLTGERSAAIAVSLPADFALSCIREMIGEDDDIALGTAVVHNGIGEMISMIAESAKTTLAGVGHLIEIATPTITSGRGHEIHHAPEATNTSIIFVTDQGDEFALDVSIQPE